MSFASVCILSYEREAFLRQAIQTLRSNSHYPLEIIVHDDGSESPGVRSLTRSMLDAGLISALIENPPGHNQGQGIALNRMFSMAKGDPIVKADQDLLFHEGWLRRVVEILEQNELRLNEEPPIGALGLFRYPAPPVRYEDMFIRDWGSGPGRWEQHQDFVGSAMVIPRAVWEYHGPFEERSPAFAEDYAFKMHLKERGYALALAPEDLVTNQGFGHGPSTVVVKDDKGELTSHAIKPGSYVLGQEETR